MTPTPTADAGATHSYKCAHCESRHSEVHAQGCPNSPHHDAPEAAAQALERFGEKAPTPETVALLAVGAEIVRALGRQTEAIRSLESAFREGMTVRIPRCPMRVDHDKWCALPLGHSGPHDSEGAKLP